MNKFFLKTILLLCFIIVQPIDAMVRSSARIQLNKNITGELIEEYAQEVHERKHAIELPFFLAHEFPPVYTAHDEPVRANMDPFIDIICAYASEHPFNRTQERKSRYFAPVFHAYDAGHAQEDQKYEEDYAPPYPDAYPQPHFAADAAHAYDANHAQEDQKDYEDAHAHAQEDQKYEQAYAQPYPDAYAQPHAAADGVALAEEDQKHEDAYAQPRAAADLQEDQKYEYDQKLAMDDMPLPEIPAAQKELAEIEQGLDEQRHVMEELDEELNRAQEAERLEQERLDRIAQEAREAQERYDQYWEQYRKNGKRYNAQEKSLFLHIFSNGAAVAACPLLMACSLGDNFFHYITLPEASLTPFQLLKKRLFESHANALCAQIAFMCYNYTQFIIHISGSRNHIRNRSAINGIKGHCYYVLLDLLHRYGADLYSQKTDLQPNTSILEANPDTDATITTTAAPNQKQSSPSSFTKNSLWAIKTAAAAYLASKRI